jgi:spermidine/putrescine transport system ATP-binding protein
LEKDEGPAPTEWNEVKGLLRMASFVGVSHQYTVEGPGGKELTVYAQNDGADNVPHPGERVRLLWRPEHTFVVATEPSDAAGAEPESAEAVTKERKK